jgi:hypothetical protein
MSSILPRSTHEQEIDMNKITLNLIGLCLTLLPFSSFAWDDGDDTPTTTQAALALTENGSNDCQIDSLKEFCGIANSLGESQNRYAEQLEKLDSASGSAGERLDGFKADFDAAQEGTFNVKDNNINLPTGLPPGFRNSLSCSGGAGCDKTGLMTIASIDTYIADHQAGCPNVAGGVAQFFGNERVTVQCEALLELKSSLNTGRVARLRELDKEADKIQEELGIAALTGEGNDRTLAFTNAAAAIQTQTACLDYLTTGGGNKPVGCEGSTLESGSDQLGDALKILARKDQLSYLLFLNKDLLDQKFGSNKVALAAMRSSIKNQLDNSAFGDYITDRLKQFKEELGEIEVQQETADADLREQICQPSTAQCIESQIMVSDEGISNAPPVEAVEVIEGDGVSAKEE